jgi:uncharacterized protein YjbJ (UPF0337 family)
LRWSSASRLWRFAEEVRNYVPEPGTVGACSDLQAKKCLEKKMDKQRMEGGLKKATGTLKEKAGEMTGDRDLEAEGKTDKAEGKVRSAVGHAKDAVKEIVGKD